METERKRDGSSNRVVKLANPKQQRAYQRARGGILACLCAPPVHPVQSQKGVSHITLCPTIRLTNAPSSMLHIKQAQKYISTSNFCYPETRSVLQRLFSSTKIFKQKCESMDGVMGYNVKLTSKGIFLYQVPHVHISRAFASLFL